MDQGLDQVVGSLTVVGTGIRVGLQTTPEARRAIERADKVFYLVADPVAALWIHRRNEAATSLHHHYATGRPRVESYAAMTEEILSWVRRSLDVCVALYGHPGVFVDPSHAAIQRAREEGFRAAMLPAVSAEDCLVADLGVDPGDGWHVHEATEFLLRGRRPDPTVALVLWQIGAVGVRDAGEGPNRNALQLLVQRLRQVYEGGQEVTLYVAADLPLGGPWIRRVTLDSLPDAKVPELATLYVPPASAATEDAEAFALLGQTMPST